MTLCEHWLWCGVLSKPQNRFLEVCLVHLPQRAFYPTNNLGVDEDFKLSL